MPSNRFLELLAEKKAKEEAEAAELAAKEATKPTFDADLIPEHGFDRSDEDIEIDQIIDRIGIVQAYSIWCGKMTPHVKPGQVESIMVSCPHPSHPDKNPSAWLNTNLNAGNCAIHGGFDALTIAGWSMGYETKGSDFHKVRRAMAERLGYTFRPALGGGTEIVAPAIPVEPETSSTPVENAVKTNLTGIPPKTDTTKTQSELILPHNVEALYDHTDEVVVLPKLDINTVLPGTGTFMDIYCEQTLGDQAPAEYHFINSMLAVGLAVGKEARLVSREPVCANLFVCMVGQSGTGKSLSMRHLFRLLGKALPYDYSNPLNRGVIETSPSSPEKLVDVFSKPMFDPSNPKILVEYAPVKGLVSFDEFAGLIAKTQRIGNPLKQVLMEFYDTKETVRTQSMTTDKIAKNPFANCVTSTQPIALRELITKSDNAAGFANRWIFMAGEADTKTMMGGKRVDIMPAVEPLEKIAGWAASFRGQELVEYEDEALEAMSEFVERRVYKEIADQQNPIFNRLDLTVQKIALILACNEQRKLITVDIVRRTILLYDYLFECYGVIAGQIGTTVERAISDAVTHQLKRLDKGQGVSLGSLRTALRGRKIDDTLLTKVLDAMAKLGALEEVAQTGPPKAGRPTKRYRYVS